MEKKPVLSIALLVSNRKDTIQKCLDSLTPIREAIPSELIILDTGCDADLRELLETYADKIDDFTWIKDFSAARNATLKHATGEWYMYLDDDEWFVDTTDLIEFFQSGEYKEYGYASYIQRNYLDMEAGQWADAWVSRMIKRTPDLHFESKIHEYMMPMSGNCKGLHSYVDHYGYVYETEEALWKHYERNATLLKEMIEEEPTNLRWRIHLAQEYRTMRMWHELYDMGTQCLSLVEGKDEMYSNIYLGCFYAARILAMREQGLDAWREAGAGGAYVSPEDLASAEAQNSWKKSGAETACALTERMDSDIAGVLTERVDSDIACALTERMDSDIAGVLSKNPVADTVYFYKQGIRLCKHALNDKRNTELFQAFCELRMTWFTYWLGRYDEAEAHANTYLKWLEFFEKNEPLLFLQKSSPIVCDAFDEVMKKEVYSILMCVGLRKGNVSYLQQYFDKLEWTGHYLYVFEDMVPVLIEAMDYIPANEETEQVFGKVLGTIQNHGPLCEYYNEELKKAELRKIGKNIKEQLRILIDAGMREQALAVIGQVKQMLPGDAELEKMEKALIR